MQIDVATFILWVDAHEQPRAGLAAFYRARFRNEFERPFAAWLATTPFTNRSAPKTPFAMPQYRLKAVAEADRLESVAARASQRAKDANEHADNYMLAVVLFASSLFFAGLSVKLQSIRARAVTLGLGCSIFVGTLIWVSTLPVQLTT